MCQEALDLERSNGKERTESKCRKDEDHDLWYGPGPPAGKFPCTVFHTGVGSNNIFCNVCKHWVHKKCSGLKRLTKDPDYRRTWCQGTARPLNGRQQKEVQVGPDKLEVVASFCYLGDMLSAAGGCELSTTTCVKMPGRCGHVYSSCVHSAMLHASETWPLTKPNLKHLQQYDRAMIRQICNVRPQDIVTIRSNELLARFGIEDLDLILKERRLRWYGHVECSNGAVKTAFYIQVEKSVVLGGPRWHGSSGQTGIAETRSSPLLTLMIDIREDLGWDLPCLQQARSLEVGPLMWMLQHVNPCPAEPRYALPLQTV